MIEIWNPNSSDKFGIHYYLESGIHGDESRQSWIPLHETKKLNQFFCLHKQKASSPISHKFSFPPRKPRDSAKRENCLRKRAAD